MRAKSSRAEDGEISFGEIIGVFGVHGELRLFLHNRDSELLHEGREVTLISPDGERRSVSLRTRSGAGGRVLGRVEGVRDPDEAKALMGWEIVVRADALPALEDDEFYHAQLLGLAVRTDAGRELGEIQRIWSNGPVDVWETKGPLGEAYIPALSENILAVDLDAGWMEVRDACVSTS